MLNHQYLEKIARQIYENEVNANLTFRHLTLDEILYIVFYTESNLKKTRN